MYSQLFYFLLTIFVFIKIISPESVDAHVGGGPPFLLINGQYAQTNPYYVGLSTINVPQDYNHKSYVLNTPIKFEVDTAKLLVPPDIAQNTTYRWTFMNKYQTVKYGQSIIFRFSSPGSFIVILDALAPGESQYVNIDTTQIDVLPSKSYKLPVPKIAVETDNLQADKIIKFKGSVATDNSSQILKTVWDFGDGDISNSVSVDHKFQTFTNYTTYFVIFRAVDKNGLTADTGIIVESIKGKLVFIDKNGNKNTIPISTSYSTSNNFLISGQKNMKFYILIFFVTLVTVAGIIILLKLISKKR